MDYTIISSGGNTKPHHLKEVHTMSIDMMNAKVKELRELKRMADELAGEIEAIQDEIKTHMTESNTNTLTGIDWKITWKAVTSKRLDRYHPPYRGVSNIFRQIAYPR